MSVLDLKAGTMTIPFTHSDVRIGDTIYQQLIATFRLLTAEEVFKVDRFSNLIAALSQEDQDEWEMEDDIYLEMKDVLMEEEIFTRCFIGFIGVDEELDMDNIEAGVITTVARAITRHSFEHIADSENAFSQYLKDNSNIISLMKSAICRYQNMKLEDAELLPINELYRRFAMCQMAFPECKIKQDEEGDGDE